MHPQQWGYKYLYPFLNNKGLNPKRARCTRTQDTKERLPFRSTGSPA